MYVRGDSGCCSTVPTRKSRRRRIIACASPEHSESLPNSPKNCSWMQNYHPSEDIREPLPVDNGELARLTDAETTRTLIEVNIAATLMLTEDIGEVRQNIICPDVPYLTDESGDIYFEATNNDRILRNFTSEDADDTLVQVIICLDNLELLTEIGASGSSAFSFDVDEVISKDEDLDYDSEEDDLVIFEEATEQDDDDVISEMSNDWSHAETMQATHPVYFAQKNSEVVSHANLDWMDQPSASIIIQGLLKPAFVEEHNDDAGSSKDNILVNISKTMRKVCDFRLCIFIW
ncbi:hypothetical protein KSP40_PGU005263 [Platanthera guangdongensis]|uniref:Uncharacterized protein n=1 Tax=Platanthera guangdongensis TaxID=2320717 RepID=A0ABR2MXY2_9ASPA